MYFVGAGFWLSLAILLAAGMSLYETFNSGAHAYFDAALSLTFFLLIGRYMDHRTRSNATRRFFATMPEIRSSTASDAQRNGRGGIRAPLPAVPPSW